MDLGLLVLWPVIRHLALVAELLKGLAEPRDIAVAEDPQDAGDEATLPTRLARRTAGQGSGRWPGPPQPHRAQDRTSRWPDWRGLDPNHDRTGSIWGGVRPAIGHACDRAEPAIRLRLVEATGPEEPVGRASTDGSSSFEGGSGICDGAGRPLGATPGEQPAGRMIAETDTDIWNDSCAVDELEYALSFGAVGATANQRSWSMSGTASRVTGMDGCGPLQRNSRVPPSPT